MVTVIYYRLKELGFKPSYHLALVSCGVSKLELFHLLWLSQEILKGVGPFYHGQIARRELEKIHQSIRLIKYWKEENNLN